MRKTLIYVTTGMVIFSYSALAQERLSYEQGMRPGMGYDFIDAEFKDDCLSGPETTAPYAAVSSEWSWEETLTTSEIQKLLSISVSAAYKALMTNVSGKASFVSNTKTGESAAYFVGR